jgi:tRNA threonylcarbamoyladenosine biosynthesis protein TsaE
MSPDWQDLLQGVTTRSPEETECLGAALARAIPENTVLALQGDLGAGKTTFVRGLARGLNIPSSIHSPSFNIYFIHQGDRQLIHCDAYRLNDPSDFDELLIEDFLSPPWLIALEWPEKVQSDLLENAWTLRLELQPEDDSHSLKLEIPSLPESFS